MLGTEPGVWLAVTSISFDISVLELFWTLTRGFKVVIQAENDGARPVESHSKPARRKMDFSLFYFASDAMSPADDKYRLLIEGAKFADQHGFTAVWTPERHFHPFGGLFPNPSVISAALAMVTRRVELRAGSVALPIHHPVRVAEEWSVLDNLSKGRVAISFASGWHASDFIFAPDNFPKRKEIMARDIEIVRKLWRGEAVSFLSGVGESIEVEIFPKPIQRELPMWITSSGDPETFHLAGELGANLLTFLSSQGLDQLANKIAIFREAWRKKGHRGEGVVTLMLHTFVWDDVEALRGKVRGPLREYLRTFRDLMRNSHTQPAVSCNTTPANDEEAKEQIEMLLDNAADRYFETSSLLGTPEACQQMVDRLAAIGVDEIACLIDFGVDTDSVLASLERLNQLRERNNFARAAAPRVHGEPKNGQWRPVPEQILRHGVTHMQCTPSLARGLGPGAGVAGGHATAQQASVGRGGTAGFTRAATRGNCALSPQYVWPDRDHRLVRDASGRRRERRDSDWPAHREHGNLRARQKPSARACRCAGRNFYRRRGRGARLLEPARTHRGKIHPPSLRHGSWRAALSHRRPRPLAHRRSRRIPRTPRPSGEAARPSHRTRGNRNGALPSSSRARGRRRSAGRYSGRQTACGLRRPGARNETVCRRTVPAPPAVTA
ncbi:MAG: LLM class flavin-dependent oxidoreductase [Verrucomicrobia bacterium]|nr:LLM class flavin-dependent oxidoreductase [Verrucomicrobiota bacterium]